MHIARGVGNFQSPVHSGYVRTLEAPADVGTGGVAAGAGRTLGLVSARCAVGLLRERSRASRRSTAAGRAGQMR